LSKYARYAQQRKDTVQPESALDALECVSTLYNMNENVKINNTTILSNNWYTLKKVTFDYLKKKRAMANPTPGSL